MTDAKQTSAWQPIETAPKDTTPILAIGYFQGSTQWGVVWWRDGWQGACSAVPGLVWTHWMRLPHGPAGETPED